MDLVSVVIPTYKRPDRLALSLDSILNQTYKNIEVVLVDDNGIGSEYDDATARVAQKYSKVFNNFVYVKNKVNLGGGGARNEGIRFSNGVFVAFLDDDDLFVPEKIELQINKFRESELDNLGFVYCQMTVFDDVTGLELSRTNNFFRGNKKPFIENMKGCIAGTPTILIKKSVLEHIQGFRLLKSGQDWALILDVLEWGYNIDYLSESLVNVYVSPRERISNSPGKIESLENDIKNIKDGVVVKIDDKIVANKIYYYHYLQLANALKFKDKRKAIFYYFKMCRYEVRIADTGKFFIGFIFGEKFSTFLRLKFSKIVIKKG